MKLQTLALIATAILLLIPSVSNAQSRDFLTEEEVEIVRDTQHIDERIDVLIYAADRRFSVLGIDVGGKTPASGRKTGEDKWGKLPAGDRIDLLSDVKRILQKAIDDIDNISARPDSAILPDPNDKKSKKPKTLEELFPKAVRSLAAAASRFKPGLMRELDATLDQKQKGTILASIESCDAILESVVKLTPK